MARGGDGADEGISIVIPAFNEELRLPPTLDRLIDELPHAFDVAWEIVVCDDGSTDATADVVRGRYDDRVRLVSSAGNRGKGAALVAGARAASHDRVVLLDADLPVTVGDLARLDRAADRADVVLASRRLPGAVVHPPQPLVRRVGAAGFRLALVVLGYHVATDPQCGAKLLRLDTAGAVLDDLRSDRFAFDVELILRARNAGLVVTELPVTWRHVPGSSLRPWRDAVRTLADLARLRRELRPRADRRSGERS